MKILISDDKDEIIYKSLLQFFTEVKVIQGPRALDSTLFRHKNIKKFLIEYQKAKIEDFDEKLETLQFKK